MANFFCTVTSLRGLSASDDIIKAVPPQSVARPDLFMSQATRSQTEGVFSTWFSMLQTALEFELLANSNADVNNSQCNLWNIAQLFSIVT